MSAIRFIRDARGATAVEFAVTAPVYLLLIFTVIMGGLLFWMQNGLQHGAEMAARCASIDKVLCNSVEAIQTYASSQSYGLNPGPDKFTVTSEACGNQVVASYELKLLKGLFGMESITLDARSCFPK